MKTLVGGVLTAGKVDLTVGWPVLSNDWLIKQQGAEQGVWERAQQRYTVQQALPPAAHVYSQ